jgi:hypothetical protein
MADYRAPIPLIWLVELVPQAEKDDAWALLTATQGLCLFVKNFEMAVRLFDFAVAEAQIALAELQRVSAGPPSDVLAR